MRHNRRPRWTIAWIVALLLAGTTSQVVLAARLWTLTGSPLTASVGVPRTVTLNVKNIGGSGGGDEIGCVQVDVPTAFSISSVAVVSIKGQTSGHGWQASTASNGGTVRATFQNPADNNALVGLPVGDTAVFRITGTATVAGLSVWTGVAHDHPGSGDANCGSGTFPTLTLTLTVALPALPTPTPAPTSTPIATPAPTPRPSSPPTPTPTPVPTPVPTSTPSPVPTMSLPPLPLPSLTLPPLPLPSISLPPLPLPSILATPRPSPTPSPRPGTSAAPSPSPSGQATASASPANGSAATPGPSEPPADGGGAVPPGSGGSGGSGGSSSGGSGPGGSSGAGSGGGSGGAPGGPGGTDADGPAFSIGGDGPDPIVPIANAEFAGFDGIDWAVPALTLSVPGLLLMLAVLAQLTASAIWLPMARRWLGAFGVGRRRRRDAGDPA